MTNNTLMQRTLNWGAQSQQPIAYTPYGHRLSGSGWLGFNGERPDPVTGHYLLGRGYRGFNPILMRFNSPDSMSPFGLGGLNPYGYCQQDPINFRDPSGHVPFGRFFSRLYGRITKKLGGHKIPKREGAVFKEKRRFTETSRTYEQRTIEAPLWTRGGIAVDDYDFVGYHGSQIGHASSLQEKVKLQSGKRNVFGPGFYFSQSRDVAEMYTGMMSREKGQGHVFGVFIKDFKGLKAGVDIDNISDGIRDSYVVREAALDRVMVRTELGAYLVRRNSYRR